jgi:hypothetical protein
MQDYYRREKQGNVSEVRDGFSHYFIGPVHRDLCHLISSPILNDKKPYLEISVNNALFMHVVHSFQHLPDKIRCIFFCVRALLDDPVKQLAASDPVSSTCN